MINNQKPEIIKFSEADFNESASNFLFEKISQLQSALKGNINIALSGGSTPLPILTLLKTKKIDWERINFFMVDERCVPISDKDSNFGNLKNCFFDFISSKKFSMVQMGVSNEESAHEYENIIFKIVPLGENGLPKFDLILLGMGDDGHTASLFPKTKALLEKDKIIVINDVPQLNTKRITMTYPLLLNAKELVVIVKGTEKEKIIKELYSGNSAEYPVLKVVESRPDLKWLLG